MNWLFPPVADSVIGAFGFMQNSLPTIHYMPGQMQIRYQTGCTAETVGQITAYRKLAILPIDTPNKTTGISVRARWKSMRHDVGEAGLGLNTLMMTETIAPAVIRA